MSTNYVSHDLRGGSRDGCYEVLQETHDHFAAQNLSILGEGIADILTSDELWSDYKSGMMKRVDPNEQTDLGLLMDNSRVSILRESLSGITPISSLSVPTIRRLWPKIALKSAFPTEVVKLPKFSVSYMRPYLIRDGKKYYLPEAMLEGGEAHKYNMGTRLFEGDIALADFNIGSELVDGARKGFNLLDHLPDGSVASKAVGDSIDTDFAITSLKMKVVDKDGNETVQEIPGLNIVCSLQSGIYFDVSNIYAAADRNADGTLKDGAVKNSDKLFGSIDFENGILNLASAFDKIVSVKIRGRLSQEMNNRSESISFDIDTREITVGTGQHLNAPLPVEFLQDVMAMYNIDGAAKIVDIMTTAFAQRLDLEMKQFITDANVRMNKKYYKVFDCKPWAQFNGTPKQWREQIKDVVEYQAQRIRQDNFFSGGEFVIVGNPLDTALFPNVTWIFQSGAAGTDGAAAGRSGVEVDYSISTWSGVNRYTIVASQSIPQGSIFMFFVSSLDEQMTFKYFPYAFNVEKGYIDPNFSKVPSIMMAKRHKLETFRDTVSEIKILNNKGDVNFVNDVETNTP